MNLRLSIRIRSIAISRLLILGVPSVLCIPSTGAQHPAEPDHESSVRSSRADVEAFVEVGSFGKSLQRFDWNKELPYIEASLQNMWKDNGWTDEADLFARDTAIAVSEIPPWKPLARISYITDKFAERYDASDALKLRVSLLLVREASGLLIRHGKALMTQSTEYLEMREAGKEFAAKDVARWAVEGQPFLDDLHETSDRIFEKVREQLNPAQREILDRDFQSYTRRRKTVEKMMKRWSAGEWTPEDWGITNDMDELFARGIDDAPAQPDELRLNAVPAEPLMPTIAAAVVRIRCDEFDPRSWGACAAEIIDKYSLDAGQRTTADSIVVELSGRALDYHRRRKTQLDNVAPAERENSSDYEPIRKAYAEMIERLKALPTTAQRVRAEEAARPSPN